MYINVESMTETGLKLSTHSQEMAEDSCEDTLSQEARRKKKARTTFTGRQIFELEKQFEVKKYLSSSERADMAKLLNVTETQVSVFFLFLFYNICQWYRIDLKSVRL